MHVDSSESTHSDSELADTLMEGYIAWREAAAAVQLSYERWERAVDNERAQAFDAYEAALDREELAAGQYRALVDHVMAVR